MPKGTIHSQYKDIYIFSYLRAGQFIHPDSSRVIWRGFQSDTDTKDEACTSKIRN